MSNSANLSEIDDMIDEGRAMATLPSFSFCIRSLSSPIWPLS